MLPFSGVRQTGQEDGVVRTFSIASGQMARELRGDGPVFAVDLFGSVLLSGLESYTVEVWSLATIGLST